ncbi:MAG: glycosyltransferase family 4 protein [Acidobacteriota bacterium]
MSQRWAGQAESAPPVEIASFRTVEIGRASLFGAAAGAGLRAAPWSRAPLQARLFEHAAFDAAVDRAVSRLSPDVVVVVLSRLGALAAQLCGPRKAGGRSTPVLVDLVDSLGANMERRADRERWLAPLWRREARRLHAWDRDLLSKVRAATVVAERDRRAILDAGPDDQALEEKLRVAPFALDVAASAPPRELAGAADGAVVLTGNLGYFPTVEGARWFASAVWPLVRRRRPGARWVLAGSRPAPAIRAAASEPGVELVENPPDLGAILGEAAVAIAPLRAGSGTPIKILEAMAAGVATVTTPAGAEGLDELPEGCLAVASAPEDFADRVVDLLENRAAAAQQAASARRWLLARHHLPRAVGRFEAVLREIADLG